MNKINTFTSVLMLMMVITVFKTNNAQNTMNAKQHINKKSIHPEWSKNANIYEVNIRQFSKEGTFKAFEKQIDRLHNMGVDILWLMPINPIGIKNRKGSLGSYYSISDYTKVNPEFGTLDDLKSIVSKAHLLGMHVIIDWVANHSAWDNPWAKDHPDWYKQDSLGNFIAPFDWTDVIALNYKNKELRKAMIQAMQFWIKEVDIDGFRCDVAEMVAADFWNEARAELDKSKPVFMLAEAEVPVHHKKAFDMSYAWELHHIMNKIADGKLGVHDIDKYLLKQDTLFPLDAYRMIFIDNHDENSWNGTVEKRMGIASPAFAVLSATLPGMILLYNGQEAGLNKSLAFFEKDEIDWKDYPLQAFYTSVLKLKTNNKALWNGNYGGKYSKILTDKTNTILAFSRKKDKNTIIVIANLSKLPLTTVIDFKGLDGNYMEWFTSDKISLMGKMKIQLKAWEYKVYVR
ncbi:MAG: alpha-amylase family glycosyl hydrolase [Bacteroidales bacterium]